MGATTGRVELVQKEISKEEKERKERNFCSAFPFLFSSTFLLAFCLRVFVVFYAFMTIERITYFSLESDFRAFFFFFFTRHQKKEKRVFLLVTLSLCSFLSDFFLSTKWKPFRCFLRSALWLVLPFLPLFFAGLLAAPRRQRE